MCENCEGFSEREATIDHYRFRDLVRQLDALLNRLVFVLIEGQEDWPIVVSGREPYSDIAFFKFECPHCRSVFQLFADLYHGNANWRLLLDRQLQSTNLM